MVAVSAGNEFVLFIKGDGSLWGTGRNHQGQLGDSTTQDRNQIFRIVENGVQQIATGGSHSLFLKQDGSLWE